MKLAMNLLLDTHTLIWVFDGSSKLSEEARLAIEDGANLIYVSAVTAWEIAIKKSIGKLKLNGDYLNGLKQYRFTQLNITTEHCLAVESLPNHHKDPFDRLLIAQAIHEKLVMVTRDSRIIKYPVSTILA